MRILVCFVLFTFPLNVSSFVHVCHLSSASLLFLVFLCSSTTGVFFLFLCLCCLIDSGENLWRCCVVTLTRSDAITGSGSPCMDIAHWHTRMTYCRCCPNRGHAVIDTLTRIRCGSKVAAVSIKYGIIVTLARLTQQRVLCWIQEQREKIRETNSCSCLDKRFLLFHPA